MRLNKILVPIFLVLLGLLCISSLACAESEQITNKQFQRTESALYFEQANILAYQGKYEEALSSFNKAIEMMPQSSLHYTARGNLYYEMMDYQKAMSDYEHAIKLDKKNEIACFNKGNTYYALGDNLNAIQQYNRVLELNNKSQLAYYHKANVYDDVETEDELAIENYTQVILLDGRYAAAYNNRGVIYQRNKKYAEAIEDYNKAIALNPMYLPSYSNRANAYKKIGKEDLAQKDIQYVAEQNPDILNEEKIAYQCNIFEISYVLSINLPIKIKREKFPEEKAVSYLEQGNQDYAKGLYENALENYKKAIALDSLCIEAYIKSGVICRESRQCEKAIEILDQAIKIYPDNANLYFHRGMTRLYMTQDSLAFLDFQRAVNVAPECAILYYWLAETSHEVKNKYYRTKMYKKAINLNPALGKFIPEDYK